MIDRNDHDRFEIAIAQFREKPLANTLNHTLTSAKLKVENTVRGAIAKGFQTPLTRPLAAAAGFACLPLAALGAFRRTEV